MIDPSKKTELVGLEQLREMNEQLLISSVRQHELIEKWEMTDGSLHLSEEQFRLGITNAPIPVIMHAEDGEVLQVSRSWTALTGYTHDDETVIQGWLTRAYGDGGDEVRDAMHRLFLPPVNGDNEMHSVVFTLTTSKGEERTWSFNASSPGLLADGRRFVVGMAEDITDRNRAAQALHEKQTQLAESQMRLAMELSAMQTLQEVSTELIGKDDPKTLHDKIVDAAASIMRAQFSTLQIFHAGQGNGGEFHLLAHRGLTSKAAEYWQRVTPSLSNITGAVLRTGESISVQNIEASDAMIGSDDRQAYLQSGIHSAQATPLFSRGGRILGLIATYWKQPHQPVEWDLRLLDVLARQAADLLERSQAEERLVAREKHLSLITASVPVSIVHIDIQQRIRFANQLYLKRLGMSSEEVLGKTVCELLGKENFAKIEPHLKEALQGVPQNYEIRINYPAVGERDLLVHNSPLNDGIGQVQGIVSVIEDITERNHSQILLDTQKEVLEMIVAGRELRDVLQFLARVVEERSKGSVASIMFVDDEGRLRNGASPSLPQDYLQAIDGLQVDESIGTCSAAAATAKITITADIGGDAKWQAFKHLPLGLGLVSAWSQPIIDQDGRVIGTFGTYFREKREPTELERQTVGILAKTAALAIERNRTEQKLRESEEQYRTLFSSIDEGFCILEKIETEDGRMDFCYLTANPAFAIQSGISDVVGKTIRLVVPAEADEWIQIYASVLNTGEPIRFARGLVINGRVLELFAFRIADGAHRRVAVIFQDITERIRTDEKLKQSEEWLRTIFEASHEGILVEDGERINYVNRSYLDLFGYDKAEELIGQNVSVVVSDEDVERVLEYGKSRLRGELPPETYEFKGKRKDGSLISVEASVSTATAADRVYITTMLRDIGKRKQTEEALIRIHEDLELRVETRTRQLAQANETLRTENQERLQAEAERFKLLTQIVTTQEDERRRIARDIHDHLGQGLTALRLKIASLQDEYDSDKNLSDRIAILQELTARLDAAVGFVAYELRPTVLDDLGLSSAIEEFAKEWSRHHGIPSEVHSGRLKMERLDPEVETNLYRIVQEALNNIYKHAKATNVNLVLERRKDEVVMIVEDDGVGFVPGAKRDAADPGRGLGLTGIRERAALVGGSVEFETSPGNGTTIFVRVPTKLRNGR